MEVKFVKMNPARNMTILVESPVPENRREKVAGELMDYGGVYAEQVGYILKPADPSAWAGLRMMGGEFCGNAVMSLAALLAIDEKLPKGVERVIPVECSGAEGPVMVTVRPDDISAECSLEMPRPKSVVIKTMKTEGRPGECPAAVVDLDGITHFVAPEEAVRGDKRRWAEKAVKIWAEECRSKAVGLILHRRKDNSITPLVYVKDTGSLVWEQGCGSGSAAVGAVLAHEARGPVEVRVLQPGGVIAVRADFRDGKASDIVIATRVRLAARGVAYVDG